MNTSNKALLTALAAIGMGLSASALAHDRHWHGHSKHWHKHHHERHYDRGHHRRFDHRVYGGHYYEPRYVVRERVVIHRPVYVPPAPVYYYAPPRHAGVVVQVDVPPFVFSVR